MKETKEDKSRLKTLEIFYDYWLSLIPWNVPTLGAFEEETRQERPFEAGERLLADDQLISQLRRKTRELLECARKGMIEAGNHSEVLGELYAARCEREEFFEYWENHEALEPDTMTEAERPVPRTVGDMEYILQRGDRRNMFIKEREQAGRKVVVAPLATLEKEVAEMVSKWMNQCIEYLESMKVKPRRAGTVEVKQTAAICALVYTIDRAATGKTFPGKAELERDITSRYTQFELAANTIYKETNKMNSNPTEQDCRRIAGNDWQRIVAALSNHPDKVKEYIENEIIKR